VAFQSSKAAGLPVGGRFTYVLRMRDPRLTRRWKISAMRRIGAAVASAVAALALAAGVGAARSPYPGTTAVPPFPNLPGAWSHAEINVTIKGVPHTLIVDRGRIVQISVVQLTLLERDGSIVVVPLDDSTLVTVNGKPATVLDLHRRMLVQTLRIDGGPAVRIRAQPASRG
jgi:hypothetical protein